jgi:hypothetical protein
MPIAYDLPSPVVQQRVQRASKQANRTRHHLVNVDGAIDVDRTLEYRKPEDSTCRLMDDLPVADALVIDRDREDISGA